MRHEDRGTTAHTQPFHYDTLGIGVVRARRFVEPENGGIQGAHRSQLQNREAVTARLAEVVAAALVVPKTRRPTKPSRAEKQRRLDEKKRRAAVKRERRRPEGGE
jgi:hypothetical protein